MPKPYNQTCPIAQALDIVGDRWTLLIVRDLFLGQCRFSALLASSPGIPPKLLSGRLKRLEQRGLIERVVYSQYPLRAEYRLTDEGLTLAPVLGAILTWGLEHSFSGPEEVRQAIRQKFAAAASAAEAGVAAG
jgi:DNA-binding HxlR family transcriptional regulator